MKISFGAALLLTTLIATPAVAKSQLGFLSAGGGVPSFRESDRLEYKFGGGRTLNVQAGMTFLQYVPLSLGMGLMILDDKDPFSQDVMQCNTVNGQTTSCDDAKSRESSIRAGYWLLESGVQPTFELSKNWAVAPGVLTGFSGMLGDVERSIECEGCRSDDLALEHGGMFFAPTARISYKDFGLSFRSRWFVTGNLVHMTTASLEIVKWR